MSVLGSKSSSNILIRKKIRSGKEINTYQFILHTWTVKTLYFPQPYQQQRNWLWLMKSKSSVKSIWVQKGKNHILMARNYLKGWEISHSFSYISEFRKIVLSCGKNKCSLKKILSVWNFECHVKIWISI